MLVSSRKASDALATRENGRSAARDMDGKVLTEAIERNYLEARPVKYIDTYENKKREAAQKPIRSFLDEEKIKMCFAAEWSEEMAEDELDRSFMKMEFAVGSHLLSASDTAQELLKLEHLSH